MLEEIMRLAYEAEMPQQRGTFGDPSRTNEAAEAFEAEIAGLSLEKASALHRANSCFVAANGAQEYARGFRTGVRLAVEVILGEDGEG